MLIIICLFIFLISQYARIRISHDSLLSREKVLTEQDVVRIVLAELMFLKSDGLSDIYYLGDDGNGKWLWRVGRRGKILRSSREGLLAAMRVEFRKLRL